MAQPVSAAGAPKARNTCDGSTLPDEQAEPALTATPARSKPMTCVSLCTPGMVMAAVDMVNRIPDLDEKTVRRELEGNFCRCTGYHNIVRAILDGAKAMRA